MTILQARGNDETEVIEYVWNHRRPISQVPLAQQLSKTIDCDVEQSIMHQ